MTTQEAPANPISGRMFERAHTDEDIDRTLEAADEAMAAVAAAGPA